MRESAHVPMAALRAILRRVRRVHSHEGSTGPCCLVGQQVCELTPGGGVDALGQTLVVHHAVDRQVFHRDQLKGVDEPAAVLVREIAPPPRTALIHTGDHFAPRRPLWRALLDFGAAARRTGERLLLLAEEARIGQLGACAEGSERLESYIYAHLLPSVRPRGWLSALTREADVPLAGATPANGGGLGGAFQGTVVDQLDASTSRHVQQRGARYQFAAHPPAPAQT